MSVEFEQIVGGPEQAVAEKKPKRQAPRRLPQVSLLPVEIRDAGTERRIRLAMAGVVLVALAATGGMVAWSASGAAVAQAQSADATSRLLSANAQLAKFNDVQALQQHIALGDAAVKVGGSTAVDWQKWTGLVLADMPAGFTLQSVAADAATPYETYPQGESPLERPRAATMAITAQTPSIAELPIWLRKLKGLPAYADLTFSVTHADTGYTVQVTIHLTSAVYITPLKER